MALHQAIQRVLLIGARLHVPPAPPAPHAPAAIARLLEEVAAEHRRFDERAIDYGHRYRSGFWAIYLLSALAVLCAVLPLALGWDSERHRLHPYAGVWAFAEVLLIGTVSTVYWLGNRGDWQGQWLRARTTAELTWYLPMLGPLLDFSRPALESSVGADGTPHTDTADAVAPEPNWYLRVFDPGQDLRTVDDLARICARIEPLARQLLTDCWSDPAFVSAYSQWTIATLEQQRHYHHNVTARQHALLHRVHSLNAWLFGLTAVGALLHLVIHTLWLSLITTFFPALGASLHGALAQSESYRLATTSERLHRQLGEAIEHIRATPSKAEIEAAIAVILEEHQDWNLLVRPHHLPLA
ncbi:MAG TPA: hypothetical protein VGM84_24185 [Steroidobacteraceae bacterium]|jgi:hypothetical protein